MTLIEELDKCKEIFNHFTHLIKNLALEMCHTGVDAIKISSPFAGAGFISPVHYKEFVLQYEKIIADAIQESGIHVYTHTCGGFILSTACSIAPDVKRENIQLLREVIG